MHFDLIPMKSWILESYETIVVKYYISYFTIGNMIHRWVKNFKIWMQKVLGIYIHV